MQYEHDMTIHVSDSALMHLLLSGMESYRVKMKGGKPIKVRKTQPSETSGTLWGYSVTKQEQKMVHVSVEHAATDKFDQATSLTNSQAAFD